MRNVVLAALLAALGLASVAAVQADHSSTPQASITKPISECPDPDATTWPC